MKKNSGLTFIEYLSQAAEDKSHDYLNEDGFSLIDSIRTNLQSLLNSQKIVFAWDKNSINLQQSILNYGLDNVQGFLYDSFQSAEQLCEEIQNTIVLFETRLQQVSVSVQNSEIADHLLFLVEGTCTEDNEKFEVQYQTKLDCYNSNFSVLMKNLERI